MRVHGVVDVPAGVFNVTRIGLLRAMQSLVHINRETGARKQGRLDGSPINNRKFE